jgi:EmrB/QacA subfamily drug resistance transporter
MSDPTTTGGAKPDRPAKPKISLVVPLVVACGLFMEALDSTIITTSIPQIAESLGESPLRLNLAITSYLLSLAVFVPISGWIADRFGARRVFCSAILLFTLGSALCGLSTNLPMLIATRVLQGFGGAMMTPVGRLIMLRAFSKNELITAMSYVSIPALIGPTIGPLLGGFLTTYISWRWIFYINIPIGMLGIVLALRYVRNYKLPERAPFDFRGFVLVGLGLGALELGIEQLGRHAISPLAQGGLFAAAALLLGLYVMHARARPNPVLDLQLFRIRTFRTAVGAGGLCRIGIGAIPFLLPLLLQLGFGLDAFQSGLLTFISSIGAMLLKTVAPSLLRTLGFRRLLVGDAMLNGLMIGGLALFAPDTPHWVLWSYLLIYGFVRATMITSLNALGYSDLTPGIMSKGTSIVSVVQQLSNSFGVALGATILAWMAGQAGPVTVADFRVCFYVISLLPLVSALGFLRLAPEDGTSVSGYRPPIVKQLPAE